MIVTGFADGPKKQQASCGAPQENFKHTVAWRQNPQIVQACCENRFDAAFRCGKFWSSPNRNGSVESRRLVLETAQTAQ
jgi:hypothetical protein